MKSKVLIFCLLLSVIPALSVKAQMKTYWYKEIEAFFGGGTTSYFGDVGGADPTVTGVQAVFDHLDIDLWQTRAALTAGMRLMPFKSLSFSAMISPMLISGNDKGSKYTYRGYSFTTEIVEFSAQVEYYFANRMTGFAPYIFGGAGGMAYGWKSNLVEKRVWETGNTFILGLGSRFPQTRNVTHSLDFGFHLTKTYKDNLDGLAISIPLVPDNGRSPDLLFLISYKVNFNVFTLLTYDYRGRVK